MTNYTVGSSLDYANCTDVLLATVITVMLAASRNSEIFLKLFEVCSTATAHLSK